MIYNQASFSKKNKKKRIQNFLKIETTATGRTIKEMDPDKHKNRMNSIHCLTNFDLRRWTLKQASF